MAPKKPSEFVLYSKDNCPNCDKAVQLLSLYGRKFIEVKIGQQMTLDDFKAAHPGVRSVPFLTLGDKEFTSILRLGQFLKGDK